MKASQLLFVFLPLVGNAQLIVPIDADINGGNVQINGMVEFNGKLIIGGQFDGMNGQVAPNILAWDGGTGVDDLGVPMPSARVNALMRFGNGVVFGGLGFSDYRKVFYWNGDTTIALGSLGSGSIACFAEFNGDLFVGGSFTTMDGLTVNQIARWDGIAWSALGNGLNNTVQAMAVHDGSLFIGGLFTATSDGAQELLRIARWDGTALHPLNSGLDHGVTELFDMPDALWVAGYFNSTGDSTLALDRFAKWNGSDFEPLLTDVTYAGSSANLLVPLGEYGILARAYGRVDGIYRDGTWSKGWLRGVQCGHEFQGSTFVGGQMEGDVPGQTLTFARLLPGSGNVEIEVAGIKAWVRSDGSLCYDAEYNRPDFEPVAEGGASAIFAHGHYVVGYVGDSAFTSSFSPYATENGYSQGPRCADRNIIFTDRYQRTWPIDIGMLWAHAANWSDPGYTAPEVLTSWPGNGDSGNDEPSLVAAFQDNNSDGVYEPEQGELPVIRGDKAVLVSVSDQLADTLPDIQPSMFDTQILVHGYATEQPEALYQTLFATYTFTNRSDRYYDSVVVALATDPNLGNPDDDFIGSDPELEMFYVYNADSVDQNADGWEGFGSHPPAIGIVGLSAPMRSFLYYNREGPWYMVDPVTTQHAAYYAEGLWKDGSPQMNPLTDEPTKFMFSDYPDVPGGFHEGELTNPDRRGIASFGPFYDVVPGERICFDMAFVFARDTTQDNIQNTRVLQQKVIALKDWYAQQGFGCDVYQPVAFADAAPLGSSIALYPNPAANVARLSRTDASDDLVLGIHSSTGQLLRRILWAGGSTDLIVDLHSLADGVYIIRPQGVEGKVLRLVVAR